MPLYSLRPFILLRPPTPEKLDDGKKMIESDQTKDFSRGKGCAMIDENTRKESETAMCGESVSKNVYKISCNAHHHIRYFIGMLRTNSFI